MREQIARLGKSESRISEELGWERTVLSTILRRLDANPKANVRTDTLRKLELAIGKPAQWILSGVEPAGVRLADCPGWAEAARTARERWGIPEDRIAVVAEARVPQALRHVDASLIRALTDAL